MIRKIAIIDADLVGRNKHRFPNLVCMKISSYYKSNGYDVILKTDYQGLDIFDKVFISKVFTDTPVEDSVLKLPNVEYGGTGFFYDKAPKLPEEIEHVMPDYHLYDVWIESQIKGGKNKQEFKYYLDYSIGFLTRGCFRQCQFCVNRNYKRVEQHSPLAEFYDKTRKKICLLDDNFLGCPNWKQLLKELQYTNKPFQFKQGLDERILTDEKCQMLFSSKYDGDYIFAFDNVADYDLIENKLKMLRKYTGKVAKFYVFCGFDRNDKWDNDFWRQDLYDLWKRIELLMRYQCLPYIMRFNRYEESPYRGMYITLARWCNQPSLFKKKSLREFVATDQKNSKKECASSKYIKQVEIDIPDLALRYFDLKFTDFSTIKNKENN